MAGGHVHGIVCAVLVTLALSACGVKNCTRDGSCDVTLLTPDGIRYVDAESGITTEGPTVEQLARSKEYRFPLNINSAAIEQIQRADALAYLQKAVAVADRQYLLCGYDPQGLWITGVNGTLPGVSGAIPFEKLRVVAAHGTVVGNDNYIVFARFRPLGFIDSFTCIAYRRVNPTESRSNIATEMEGVVEALLRLNASLQE